jgi:hypothetical protein
MGARRSKPNVQNSVAPPDRETLLGTACAKLHADVSDPGKHQAGASGKTACPAELCPFSRQVKLGTRARWPRRQVAAWAASQSVMTGCPSGSSLHGAP